MQNYQQFWEFYLSQHSKVWTRRFHAAGILAGAVLFLAGVTTNRPLWVPLSVFVGYLPAWISHFLIERNFPATFKHPIWSFVSDFRMTYLMLTKKL